MLSSLFALTALLGATTLTVVDGHGFMYTPRSRNWVAHEDGESSGGSANAPLKEYCHHCLNRGGLTDGICGIAFERDYTYPEAANGQPLGFHLQETYTEGATFVMESVLTTHHKGHFEMYACPDVDNLSKDCFDQYPMEFVQDLLYGAPKDPNYPNRGMCAPNSGEQTVAGGMFFSMEFKLPEGLVGEEIVLLWKYMTSNSCIYEGYDEYPWPAGWHPGNLGPCEPIPVDGVGGGEQFWNCADVKIISADPTVSPAPTRPPTPTVEPTPDPTSGSGCCSQNYRDCNAPWAECGVNQCCGDAVFLRGGADTTPGCVPRWTGGCYESMIGCCGGATCKEEGGWYQCIYEEPATSAPVAPPTTSAPVAPTTDAPVAAPVPDPTDSPVAAPVPDPTDSPVAAPVPDPVANPTDAPVADPVATPTNPPVGTEGCCSNDFKYCHEWGNCSDGCCLGTKWISQGADPEPCVPRWQACTTNDDCCGGTDTACVTQPEGYMTCVYAADGAAST